VRARRGGGLLRGQQHPRGRGRGREPVGVGDQRLVEEHGGARDAVQLALGGAETLEIRHRAQRLHLDGEGVEVGLGAAGDEVQGLVEAAQGGVGLPREGAQLADDGERAGRRDAGPVGRLGQLAGQTVIAAVEECSSFAAMIAYSGCVWTCGRAASTSDSMSASSRARSSRPFWNRTWPKLTYFEWICVA